MVFDLKKILRFNNMNWSGNWKWLNGLKLDIIMYQIQCKIATNVQSNNDVLLIPADDTRGWSGAKTVTFRWILVGWLV